MVAVVMVVLIGFGVLALDHEWSVMAGKKLWESDKMGNKVGQLRQLGPSWGLSQEH